MALDFPSSPTVGQTYTLNNRTWTWDGTAWTAITTTYAPASVGSSDQVVLANQVFG